MAWYIGREGEQMMVRIWQEDLNEWIDKYHIKRTI